TEHRAQGHNVFPAAGQCEVVTAAARHVFGTDDLVLEDVELRRPMILTSEEDDAAVFRLEVYADDGRFVIASRVAGETDTWIEHTRGHIRRCKPVEGPRFDLDELAARIQLEVFAADRYRAYSRAGLELGPTFRGIHKSHRNAGRTEFFAEILPHPALEAD